MFLSGVGTCFVVNSSAVSTMKNMFISPISEPRLLREREGGQSSQGTFCFDTEKKQFIRSVLCAEYSIMKAELRDKL